MEYCRGTRPNQAAQMPSVVKRLGPTDRVAPTDAVAVNGPIPAPPPVSGQTGCARTPAPPRCVTQLNARLELRQLLVQLGEGCLGQTRSIRLRVIQKADEELAVPFSGDCAITNPYSATKPESDSWTAVRCFPEERSRAGTPAFGLFPPS